MARLLESGDQRLLESGDVLLTELDESGGGDPPSVIPPPLQHIDNQFAAIAAAGLNGVLQ